MLCHIRLTLPRIYVAYVTDYYYAYVALLLILTAQYTLSIAVGHCDVICDWDVGIWARRCVEKNGEEGEASCSWSGECYLPYEDVGAF